MNDTKNTEGNRPKITTRPLMTWDEANFIADDLINKFDYGLGLMIKMGIYTPLLISEMLRLTWGDLLENENKAVKGIKDKKNLFIFFNPKLQQTIIDVFHRYRNYNLDVNAQKTTMTTSVIVRHGVPQNSTQINRFFAKLPYMYPNLNKEIKPKSLRATFGRRIVDIYGDTPEVMALLKLLFGQPSTTEVRRALYFDNHRYDLSHDMVLYNLHLTTEREYEVDGTIHRGNLI